MLVAAAACEWKLNKLSQRELDRLPDTNDEAGARRLYLLMELARDKNDTDRAAVHRRIAEVPLPHQPLAGRGPLLQRKHVPAPQGLPQRHSLLQRPRHALSRMTATRATAAPCSDYSPYVHWRAAWLTYRLGNYTDAAKMFDDQIKDYPDSPRSCVRALLARPHLRRSGTQPHHGREILPHRGPRLSALLLRRPRPAATRATWDRDGRDADDPTGSDELDGIQPQDIPELSDDVPDQDPHLVKARLLANAGLNEYISPEIQAADGSDHWGSLAEAQIYASYGENWHAMRLMKRALPYYVSAPISSLPRAYWRILFPEPYWSTIKECAAHNGLDPYMVASLIRQESEFNPSVISYANAYGLMQLLPSVGRSMAHQAGIRHFETRDLLDPKINIRLGCLYLKQMLDKFGDHPEYAFAAYNAGDSRVTDWQSDGRPYHDMDEFVESIPFTQTRDYVQAILRNETIYRELDKASYPAGRQDRGQQR